MRTKRPPIKVVFLGETGTGKTSIIKRYAEDAFAGDSQSTVGGHREVVSVADGDREAELVLWDTAGQEQYRALTPMYYRGAAAAVIVFDVTNRDSFDQIQGWINELQTTSSDTLIVLCGNKIDMGGARMVNEAEAGMFAETARTPYCETSAKTGSGVKLLFVAILQTIAQARPGYFEEPAPIQTQPQPAQEEESCC
jgi:Ras-related protein Rab-5C